MAANFYGLPLASTTDIKENALAKCILLSKIQSKQEFLPNSLFFSTYRKLLCISTFLKLSYVECPA